MEKFMRSKTAQFIIVTMVLTLLVSSIPGSAFAANSNEDEKIQEKGILALEALNLNDNKTNFSSFDSSYAKENGLTNEEITNAKTTFLNLSDKDASIFVKAKKQMESEISTFNKGVKDIFTLATLIAGLTVVGQAMIGNLLDDLYELGAKGFCNSWAGEFSAIDSACESLGYK